MVIAITHQLTQTKWPSTENHDSLSASWSPKWGLYCLFPLFSFTRSSLGTGKQGEVQGRSYKRVTTPRTTKIDSPMSVSNPLCEWQMVSNQLALGSLGVGCLSRGIILPAKKKLWPPPLSPTFGTCETGREDPIGNCDCPFWTDSGGLFRLPSSSSYLPANTRCLSSGDSLFLW